MFTVNINGKEYESAHDKKLLRFLRDDLHLTAAKDGCSEGVCGTCTVLVDGKKTKACVVSLSRLEGKKVLTVEGIPPEEIKVYEHCFAEAGAVQCGFCIPGMVISAKSLLDVNLNPTRREVKEAIKGNLCRCTGYKKIEDGILMAAEYFREKKEIPPAPKSLRMNERAKRIDTAEKVNGTGMYADDLEFVAQHLDDTEFLQVFSMPLEEIIKEIEDGNILDGKTIVLAYKLDRLQKELQKTDSAVRG